MKDMEKTKAKSRDIQFFSEKNQKQLCVHSKLARVYADYLEKNPEIERYEVCEKLEKGQYSKINPVGIRKEYFTRDWSTDFILYYKDGRYGIREIVNEVFLKRRALIEKLEFSRRYWSTTSAIDWKIVIV